MKLPRGMFVFRGRIPGTGGNSSGVEGREARGFRRHVALTRARNEPVAADAEFRAHGISVFDRSAGMSELGSYLRPRDDV